MAAACSHLDQVELTELPAEIPGCEDCLKIDGWWVHLRRCAACGHVACCDNSPNRHATKHFQHTAHPVVQSFEPGEKWKWCYVDELYVDPESESAEALYGP